MVKAEITASQKLKFCVCLCFKNKPSSSHPTPLVLNQSAMTVIHHLEYSREQNGGDKKKELTAWEGRPVNVLLVIVLKGLFW